MKTMLCNFSGPQFWPENTWAELAALPDKAEYLVVLPVTPLGDYGNGKPINFGETSLLEMLSSAAEGLKLRVLPPVRQTFTTRSDPTFTDLPFEAALQALLEIAQSVQQAGFHKIVLITPLSTCVDLLDIAALDMRAHLGLSSFFITPKALESGDLRAILTAMLEKKPLPGGGKLPIQNPPNS